MLTPTPNTGYHFKEWNVISGGVTIHDNSFTMPAEDVALQAVFEKDTLPSITAQPQNITVTAGQTATFSVAADGLPVPSCQWQKRTNGSNWEDIPGATDSSYTTEATVKSMDGWSYRCIVTNSAGRAESNAATLTVRSTNAGIEAVSVDGIAGTISGTAITVLLPYGQTPPTSASKISITPSVGAAVSALATADNGTTWTFTVTAEDKTTTANYTITISVAPNPAAGNIADVAAAKSTIEQYRWAAEQSAADTEKTLKTWIESQIAALDINGVKCAVSITDFTAAAAGSAANTEGTDGSFTFTASLSKGEGDTFAEDAITGINGTITATPYIAPTYGNRTLSADGVTVTGSEIHKNASLTVTKDRLHGNEDCGSCGQIREWQAQGRVIAIYDVNLSDGFRGTVTLTFPVSSEYNGKTLTVAHCLKHTLKTSDMTVSNGTVTVTADSLSPFAIADLSKDEPGQDEPPQQKPSPLPTPGTIQITSGNVSLSKKKLTYNGKAQKPAVTAKDQNGKKISSANYKTVYKNNKKVGTASVTITFTGNYSGTVTKTFDIVPKGTSISKLQAKKKGFTVKWKKQKTQTSGYQIQYSANKKFRGAKTTPGIKAKSTSKTILRLKAKKKYYVRIRTYKTVKGRKYRSAWSKAKSIKTKK